MRRDIHLLLFGMMYDWREGSEEREREEGWRDASAIPSTPGQDEVENERDCE